MSIRSLFYPVALVPALAAAVLLGGCAARSGDDFPSLARRPVEGVLTTVQSEPEPEVPVPAGGTLREQLAGWEAGSATADRAFRAAIPEAEARVAAASGSAPATESWIVAHQAVTRLDVLRGPVSRIWADLDALYVARSIAGEREGAADIEALHARLARMAAEQIDIVSRLAARIAPN